MERSHPKKRIRLTSVSTLHIIRLIYRGALFLTGLGVYLAYRLRGGNDVETALRQHPALLIVVWVLFVAEMIMRFFPSKIESPGCQKQFARNYVKTGRTDISIEDNNAAVLVLMVWIALNAVFGALRLANIIDDGIMLLLCSAYSVCDMICILFFCPFQTWFLKNKCCSTCRIYNWDYAMMFTPLFFVPRFYSWSLLALSVALLTRWELTLLLHPERFAESTNGYLSCAKCSEKLCSHKNQLSKLRKKIAERTEAKLKKLRLEK